jgi:hypothetical protein
VLVGPVIGMTARIAAMSVLSQRPGLTVMFGPSLGLEGSMRARSN